MENERENFSNTEIRTAPESGVPVFSFSATGDAGDGLHPENFDIEGNKFSAFYDSAHRLIFILDETFTENTPNALLTISAINDRKWDDILTNDFGMDLEDIRPKKNNKYQKLDIDYDGVSVYNRLIEDYKSGADITAALTDLDYFRAGVGKNLAGRRLTAATREIETASATIEKTDESVEKLRVQIKSLKSKLTAAKSGIGKKPTKESAAKILKIQAQTDKANEKIKRAQLRLRRAKKRLEDAQRDADAARKALNADMGGAGLSFQPTDKIKPRESEMADNNKEEPKPLFVQDPEIIDEKIAFQPVEFNPSSFSEPAPVMPVFDPVPFDALQSATQSPEAPVALETPQPIAPIEPIAPVTNSVPPTMDEVIIPIAAAQPAVTQPAQPAPAEAPTIMARPMSPGMTPGRTVHSQYTGNKKPTMVYYIMLILLIGLSILTLWLYQTRMDNTATPNLVTAEEAPQPTAVTPTPTAVPVEEPAFIMPPTESAPAVIEPVPAQPEPAQEEPIMTEPELEPEPESFFEQPEPTVPRPDHVIESQPQFQPFVEEPAPEPVNKPEYSVAGPLHGGTGHTQAQTDGQGYSVDGPSATSAAPLSQLCTSGIAPDEHGCCAGESLRWIESYNGYGCCSAEDEECYPPLK